MVQLKQAFRLQSGHCPLRMDAEVGSAVPSSFESLP